MDPLRCSGVMDKDLIVKGAMVCMANNTGTDVVKKKGLHVLSIPFSSVVKPLPPQLLLLLQEGDWRQ